MVQVSSSMTVGLPQGWMVAMLVRIGLMYKTERILWVLAELGISENCPLICGYGVIGSHIRFKLCCSNERGGSTPPTRRLTKNKPPCGVGWVMLIVLTNNYGYKVCVDFILGEWWLCLIVYIQYKIIAFDTRRCY